LTPIEPAERWIVILVRGALHAVPGTGARLDINIVRRVTCMFFAPAVSLSQDRSTGGALRSRLDKRRQGKKRMGPSLQEIVGRVKDPETPVIWLDPTTPADIWDRLPESLASAGHAIVHLDRPEPVGSAHDLMQRLSGAAGFEQTLPANSDAIRGCLEAIQRESRGICVVLWRFPEVLRQGDEAFFEDFVDLLEDLDQPAPDDSGACLKLIVRD
jgi:hypothetical protein